MKLSPDSDILRANLYEEQRAASQDYFGDTIKYIFIATSIIMLAFLPYFHRKIPFNFILSVGGVIVTAVCAGMTNARWRWTLLFDAVVAAIALFIFESHAITLFRQAPKNLFLLLINQTLAIFFFFALYFSIQTFRRWMTYR